MGTDDWGTMMTKFVRRLLGDVRGATAVEYGLILSLIFLACVGAISGVANKTSKVWNNVSDAANRT